MTTKSTGSWTPTGCLKLKLNGGRAHHGGSAQGMLEGLASGGSCASSSLFPYKFIEWFRVAETPRQVRVLRPRSYRSGHAGDGRLPAPFQGASAACYGPAMYLLVAVGFASLLMTVIVTTSRWAALTILGTVVLVITLLVFHTSDDGVVMLLNGFQRSTTHSLCHQGPGPAPAGWHPCR